MTYDKMANRVELIASQTGSDELFSIVEEFRNAEEAISNYSDAAGRARLRDASIELFDAYQENRR